MPADRPPSALAAALVEFVAAQGPPVSGRLLTERFGRHTLRRAVLDGVLQRVRHGQYALPDGSSSGDTATAVALARALGGVASHLTAATAWGLRPWVEPTVVTVTVLPRSRVQAPDGVQLHRRPITPADLARGRTDLLRTVLDCAASLPPAQALAIVDAAVRDGGVSAADLTAYAARYRSPGCRRARAICALADAGAANAFESALRWQAIAAGLEVQTQRWVGQGPTRFRADLVDLRRRTVIEGDGYAYHCGRAQWLLDVRRRTALTADGWVVLRFTWDDVMLRPAWVRARLAEVRQSRDGRGVGARPLGR